MTAPPALRVSEVTVELSGKTILEHVSFEVGAGEFACLCGPNGGGKTTLLKAVLGLLPLGAGKIEVRGLPPREARRRVGYLPQTKSFGHAFPASVAELIVANRQGAWPARIGAEDRERARAVLARVGGEKLLDQSLRGLSGGEKQRVFLARALVNDPELLLLDEPTAGVDARGRAEFLEVLGGIAARADLAALLVTHNEGAVRQLADRVVYLDHRVVAWGPPADVLALADRRGFGGHDHEGLALCEEE
jgi:ABC-type Mn2+/Zn2+ transport system ATPase subunit